MSKNLIIIFVFLFIILSFVLWFRYYKDDTNEMYKSQRNKKIDLGPFYVDNSGEKIFVYNPSIELDDNGSIIGVSRLTGRTFPECKTSFNKNEYKLNKKITNEIKKYPKEYRSEISSVIFWKLNDISNFKVLNSFSDIDLCDKTKSLKSALKGDLGQGIEDPRIFKFLDEFWVYGHFRGNYEGKCIHSPVIFRINEPHKVIRLYVDNMREIEKNWMPFEYENELYFEYDINPHVILKCDIESGYCRVIYVSDKINNHPISSKHLGGGAPPKLFEMNGQKYFLGFAHTREVKPVIRKNFFYVFRANPPFDIIMIGNEFDVLEDEGKDVEFGSGMLIKNNNTVIIACGISDCYSLLSEIPLNKIINSLSIL